MVVTQEMCFKGVPVQRCVAALCKFAKLYTYDLCIFNFLFYLFYFFKFQLLIVFILQL